MTASPILREVYRAYVDHFDEPSHGIVFDEPQPDGFPPRIEVLVWDADGDCEFTTFATIGMASLPLPKASHRAELHFAVRMPVGEGDRHEAARFLANLATYPFPNREPLDWWHSLSNPGGIPLFPSAECLLLHPRFVPEGWDSILTSEGEVHILNVIPTSREENALRHIPCLQDRLAERDLFEPW